jgi:hypothetical protein
MSWSVSQRWGSAGPGSLADDLNLARFLAPPGLDV